MKTYKIYLIRNGFTQGNLDGKFIGRTDLNLAEQAIKQIIDLTNNYEYPNVGRVYSSPLKSCTETARIIYPYMTPVIVDGLKELDFGRFEGKTPEELKNDPDFKAFMMNSNTANTVCENTKDFKDRIISSLNSIILDMMKNNITEAGLISHSGVIRTLLSACGLPKRKFTDWEIECGEGYTLVINSSLWSNTNTGEVFTPIPYGKKKDEVMLGYQKDFEGDYFSGEDYDQE